MSDIPTLAQKYRLAMRLAMLRLGATDDDFRACGIEPPTADEREQARAEGWFG